MNTVRRRQILLDEQSDRILKSRAAHHEGNRSLAIREILKGHDRMEALLDQIEAAQATDLRRQKERSEKGFQAGRSL